MPLLSIIYSDKVPFTLSSPIENKFIKKASITTLLMFVSSTSYVHADSMSALIAQKSVQPDMTVSVPSARISTRSTIQRPRSNYSTTHNTNRLNTQPSAYTYDYNQRSQSPSAVNISYRYPDMQPQMSTVLPEFLSGNYDNVDSQYLPLLSNAESQSSMAAREVISTARKMALNERTIIQGGCWDYLNEVFKRAGVARDTIHKGVYRQGPYADSHDIEVGDWLYYINHGYNGVEHSGLFVGWVDESAKQALILSYAGESRREPARYRVYDLSNVYQIMRPVA